MPPIPAKSEPNRLGALNEDPLASLAAGVGVVPEIAEFAGGDAAPEIADALLSLLGGHGQHYVCLRPDPV